VFAKRKKFQRPQDFTNKNPNRQDETKEQQRCDEFDNTFHIRVVGPLMKKLDASHFGAMLPGCPNNQPPQWQAGQNPS
jgi:hypothetical protein